MIGNGGDEEITGDDPPVPVIRGTILELLTLLLLLVGKRSPVPWGIGKVTVLFGQDKYSVAMASTYCVSVIGFETS